MPAFTVLVKGLAYNWDMSIERRVFVIGVEMDLTPVTFLNRAKPGFTLCSYTQLVRFQPESRLPECNRLQYAPSYPYFSSRLIGEVLRLTKEIPDL